MVQDGLATVPGPAVGRGRRGVLRGLLQRHVVAALSRRDRQADLPPGDRYVDVNRRFAEATSRGSRGRHRLGSGLSVATGSEDAAESAPGPHHRVLPAHPVPTRRVVHATAVRAEIIDGLLGADLVGFTRPRARRTSRSRPGGSPEPRPPVPRPACGPALCQILDLSLLIDYIQNPFAADHRLFQTDPFLERKVKHMVGIISKIKRLLNFYNSKKLSLEGLLKCAFYGFSCIFS